MSVQLTVSRLCTCFCFYIPLFRTDRMLCQIWRDVAICFYLRSWEILNLSRHSSNTICYSRLFSQYPSFKPHRLYTTGFSCVKGFLCWIEMKLLLNYVLNSCKYKLFQGYFCYKVLYDNETFLTWKNWRLITAIKYPINNNQINKQIYVTWYATI